MHLPLFPLGTVLFPGGWLPLQIFEVRYLHMVQRCWREQTAFGVVCLTEGHEVRRPGQTESFHPVGTCAHIVECTQPQAGLLVIGCRGGERFQIDTSSQSANGLWSAHTHSLPPDVAVPLPAHLQGVQKALKKLYNQLLQAQPDALGPKPQPGADEPVWQDAGWVANRWAELLPLDSATKQRLMALDHPLLRLELVGDLLDQIGIAH